MSNFFTKGQRKVQAQSDSTRLADAVAEGAVHSTICLLYTSDAADE